jgi:hypothetical protein
MIQTLNRIAKKTRLALRQSAAMVAPKNPVYIFHHIPKCGGTSVSKLLDSWFIIFRDYRVGSTLDYPEKFDLGSFRSWHCLCGHFELDGYYLHQRYPEVFLSDSNRYRVFTFIRDPLQVQLSLYRYEMKSGVSNAKSVEEHLMLRPNYIAQRFPATFDNYKEVIDRYYFVGILEYAQESINLLSTISGKCPMPLPFMNRTQKIVRNEPGDGELSQDLVEQFKIDNALDYLIYDYCLERFKRKLAEQAASS